jgi:hypothetical protein
LIRLALQHGYKEVDVYGVYEYRVTKYNQQTGTGDQFVDYINTFLNLKAEARCYPNCVNVPKTNTDTLASFTKAKVSCWIKKNIDPSPTKRGLVKLRQNSMWGKLTERKDRTCTKMITDPHELYRFLATSGIEVAALVFASDDIVCASWQYIAEEKCLTYPTLMRL